MNSTEQKSREIDEIILNQVLELEPNNLNAINICGKIYLKLNKYQEAFVDLNKGLKVEPNKNDPNNVRLLLIRRLIFMILVQNQESLDDFTSALGIKQTNLGIHLNKALEVSPDDRITLARRADAYRVLERQCFVRN
ncbi:22033_t:CDS:2 [Cetraspora pellucida]|uniref:22033_t:CDS:1 n=1 Tax=Cetraspora pellucida TaxID=1433469 RepID=A0A9N9JGB4_9GLOM|nr:22033_t:CDS:2 [Cetraspora pellucida]